MQLQLNSGVETFLLLLTQESGKEQKKEAIKQLNDFGINGAAFYAANLVVVEKYQAAFDSQKKRTDGNAIFEDMCEELVFIFLGVLYLHPEWLGNIHTVSEENALAVVRDMIIDILDGEEEIITALETSGFSDQAKWQITALMQQPKQRLSLVINVVNANLAAFEYAYEKLEVEITSLLVQLEDQLKKGNISAVIDQSLKFSPNAQIIPSLAAAMSIIVFDEFCIYGLLANRILSGQDGGLTNAEAILAAKALSDTSKLEILLALKKGNLYNLEIARILGLTPATTSHHMNTLLTAGFVDVSKRDGKVYYSLALDGLKRYRDWLDNSFLEGA